MRQERKFAELAKIFQLEGDIVSIDQIGNGNVNQTYDVVMSYNGVESRYVLQKVSIFVFKNPKMIMKNIEAITCHIADKLEVCCEAAIV